ncbi:hypothetical protein W02_09700 [Nitrospira sp. KM1]|uniref:DUF72 domain-containing protein n=1 Tax=Nitrospira sp. KM1 TaxID=1936990 RepID=UPI0013A7B3D8|nr:DUF72 domain-containing protein [Nitrospira sp. KM1]BCA53830.1 hypothetical protein W02_09700 [Nitrospira sp. KM1]
MAQLLIGTSGWTYASWKGKFYPKTLPNSRYLEFFATQFPTTEVNYSFYHLPKPSTYGKWAEQVSDEFAFSVKVSRFITHIKRLTDAEAPWHLFLESAKSLGTHLGPLLFQFPASFRRDDDRLGRFLAMVRTTEGKAAHLRLVFEFRHESWFANGIYRLLSRHGSALCIGDSGRYPRKDVITADFVYMRFHGRHHLFASSYSKTELAEEAKKMKRHLQNGYDVYAYFNNDAEGHAVQNARMLTALMKSRPKS